MLNYSFRKVAFISTLLLITLNVNAQWYQSEGKSRIVSDNVNNARDKAISNALLTVIRAAGTSAESIQVVESGVLEVDKLLLKSNGEIHDMRILKETIIGDIYTVTIEADIYPFSTCPQEKYAKTMLVGPFHLEKRENAQLGAIYDIDQAIPKRFFDKLKNHSNKIDPRHLMTRDIAFTNQFKNNIELQTLDISREVAARFDVQYLLFGVIKNVDDYYQKIESTFSERTIHRRNFKMDVYLIDAINQVTLFHKEYGGTTDWPYELTQQFNLNNEAFWGTAYGVMINQRIDNAITDLRQSLYCQPTMSTIIATYDDQVVINIGHKNGIEKGDQFQLIRSRFVGHQSSLQGPIFVPDDILLTVISVQSNRAILKTRKQSDMGNIQIRDMLTPADKFTVKRINKETTTNEGGN